MIRRTNPSSNKRQKVSVTSDPPHDCSEVVAAAVVTRETGKNLMGQRSGIGCDHVHVAVDTRQDLIDERCVPKRSKGRVPHMLQLTPRERVLKALRLFNIVFEELAKDKANVSKDTLDILMRDGKNVNGEKRVGVVPGVEVGDVFTYKAQLKLIGMHVNIRGGIDFKDRGVSSLATCVVISEGADNYSDRFHSAAVLTYCGEGDYLRRKKQRAAEDHKMTNGNLALVNSMTKTFPVRVVIGRKTTKFGKQYMYKGLFSVEDHWTERGPLGNIVFKFKLQRLQSR